MGRLIRRIQYLLRQRRIEADLREEMEFHRAERQSRLEEAGVPRDEAASASRRQIGNVTLAREDAREIWIAGWLERLWQDLRYGARVLVRDRGFSAVVVLTLALGIGANTAIFSVIQAVILRPLPFADPDRLMMLWTDDSKRDLHEEPTAYLTIRDWRSEARLFTDIAIFRGEPAVVLGGDGPDRVVAEYVSANLFPLLGVGPAIGRTFSDDEEIRGEPVAVLSDALWHSRFGGAPDVLERTLDLDGRLDVTKLRIIGVMPPGFAFPNRDVQFWRPSTVPARQQEPRFRFIGRSYGAVGRLRPGTTVSQARTEMSVIGHRLEVAYPSTDAAFPGFTPSVAPLVAYYTGGTVQSGLWILLSAVGLLLLLACVNAANLLLARSAARQRELAIRTSLGAGRPRLIRQLLTETAMLTTLATGCGLALAFAGIRLLTTLAPPGIYPASGSSYALTDSVRVLGRSAQPGIARLNEIGVDSEVLAFTIVLSVLTTLLFGLLPAWRMSRLHPNEALKQGSGAMGAGSRASRRSGNVLIAVECAVAVLLLAGSGLLVRSVLRLQDVDLGFRSGNVLLVRVSLAPIAQRSGVPDPQGDLMRRRDFYRQVFERVGAVPGVERVGLVTDLLVRGFIEGSIAVANRPPIPAGLLGSASVSPGFFETLGVPLRSGRFFTDADVLEQIRLIGMDDKAIAREKRTWPAVVNEMFVERYLPGESALGARFRFDRESFEIVGVAGNMRREGPERAPIAEFFQPYIGQTSEVAVRTASDPLAVAASVRDAVRSVNRNAMVLSVTTLDRRLAELGATRQAQTMLLGAFAGLALGLAAVGIYGLVRYGVSRRKHEIAIRIALGARARDVIRLVVGEGMVAPVAGTLAGVTAALWATRVMAHLLFEVTATDPLAFGAAGGLIVGAAVVACWLPARRATRVDPIAALRCE